MSCTIAKVATSGVAQKSSAMTGRVLARRVRLASVLEPQTMQSRSYRAFAEPTKKHRNPSYSNPIAPRSFSSAAGKRDFYEQLGVDRSADKASIKYVPTQFYLFVFIVTVF
jgi:hypothetical protein